MSEDKEQPSGAGEPEILRECSPSKYPIIEIKEPIEIIGDGFALEGSCKPSFFRKTRRVTIDGWHPAYANGCLVVHEYRWGGDENFIPNLIGVHLPDVKNEDVIPQYQERLKDRLAEIARR